MSIAFLIVGLIIGCVLCYFVLQPKIKNTNEINLNIQRENDNLAQNNEQLKGIHIDIMNQIGEANMTNASLEAKKTELVKSIEALQEQADRSTQIIFDKSY